VRPVLREMPVDSARKCGHGLSINGSKAMPTTEPTIHHTTSVHRFQLLRAASETHGGTSWIELRVDGKPLANLFFDASQAGYAQQIVEAIEGLAQERRDELDQERAYLEQPIEHKREWA
jgi:hypothetical protein